MFLPSCVNSYSNILGKAENEGLVEKGKQKEKVSVYFLLYSLSVTLETNQLSEPMKES